MTLEVSLTSSGMISIASEYCSKFSQVCFCLAFKCRKLGQCFHLLIQENSKLIYWIFWFILIYNKEEETATPSQILMKEGLKDYKQAKQPAWQWKFECMGYLCKFVHSLHIPSYGMNTLAAEHFFLHVYLHMLSKMPKIRSVQNSELKQERCFRIYLFLGAVP